MSNPPNLPDWRMRLTQELRTGLKARRKGNEGMARVCARRAAGIIVNEYLSRQGHILETSSAIDQLRFLIELPEISDRVRNSANLLITRLDTEYKLPGNADLIAEARLLAQELLAEELPE